MLLPQLGRDGVRVGDGDDLFEYRFEQHPDGGEDVAIVIYYEYSSLFLCHDAIVCVQSYKISARKRRGCLIIRRKSL